MTHKTPAEIMAMAHHFHFHGKTFIAESCGVSASDLWEAKTDDQRNARIAAMQDAIDAMWNTDLDEAPRDQALMFEHHNGTIGFGSVQDSNYTTVALVNVAWLKDDGRPALGGAGSDRIKRWRYL